LNIARLQFGIGFAAKVQLNTCVRNRNVGDQDWGGEAAFHLVKANA